MPDGDIFYKDEVKTAIVSLYREFMEEVEVFLAGKLISLPWPHTSAIAQ